MKIISIVFLLISIFAIEINSLIAQEQSDPVQTDLAQTNLAQMYTTPNNLTQTNPSTDSVELRKIKISVSKVLQGLATACVCIAKVVSAKTEKEKKESTTIAISSALQIATDACSKHKKKTKQNQKKQLNSSEKTSAKTPEETNAKKDEKQDQSNVKVEEKPEEIDIFEAVEDSETKSINFEYLQQIQDLNTDKERIDLIDKILQNKQETEALIDEVNSATKLILIEALVGN